MLSISLPTKLHGVGLAKENHCTPVNPRPLQDEDCRRLYLERSEKVLFVRETTYK
jgi:hypothetical protein